MTRAKKVTRNASQESKSHRDSTSSRLLGDYKPKLSSKVQSLSGRVNHLFGRAGASQFHQSGRRQTESEERLSGISRTPQSVVFEGYRASSKQSQGSLKSGGSRKKHGKPSTRSSKRGAKFKASGGKKRKS